MNKCCTKWTYDYEHSAFAVGNTSDDLKWEQTCCLEYCPQCGLQLAKESQAPPIPDKINARQGDLIDGDIAYDLAMTIDALIDCVKELQKEK